MNMMITLAFEKYVFNCLFFVNTFKNIQKAKTLENRTLIIQMKAKCLIIDAYFELLTTFCV